jgi:hypothetical protein
VAKDARAEFKVNVEENPDGAFFARNHSCLIRLHLRPSGVSHVVTSVITEEGARNENLDD